MKSKTIMLLQGALTIAASMLCAQLVARMLWGESLAPLASVGATLLAGYLGGAVYLLQHRAHIGRVARVRLAISLFTPAAIGVMALDQPLNADGLGFLMMCGTLVALPMLWLGTQDLSRGLRGLPPRTFSLGDVNVSRVVITTAWMLGVLLFALAIWADSLYPSKATLYAAGILALNGGAELSLVASLVVLFVRGAFQEMGDTFLSGQLHGSDSTDTDDYHLWESIESSRSRSSSMFDDDYNSTSSFEMWGSNETWDHDDLSHASSFDDHMSAHGMSSGMHDS